MTIGLKKMSVVLSQCSEDDRCQGKKLGKSDKLRIGFVCSGNSEHKSIKVVA